MASKKRTGESPDRLEVIQARLPESQIAALDEVVAELNEGGANANRSHLIRIAVSQYLAARSKKPSKTKK